MTDTNEIKGTWHQLKGEVKKQWGNLTDDDLKKIDGNAEKLYGKLQEYYGYTVDEAKQKVNHLLKENNEKL